MFRKLCKDKAAYEPATGTIFLACCAYAAQGYEKPRVFSLYRFYIGLTIVTGDSKS